MSEIVTSSFLQENSRLQLRRFREFKNSVHWYR